MSRPVSMRDIAAECGVSKSTVSLALKQHPSIPPATVARVKAAAARLNYRPNAMVTSLMTHLRHRKAANSKPVIAYLTAFPTEPGWKHRPTFERYFVGVAARADQLGYRVERFWLNAPGMTQQRLAHILQTRGISGVILPPAPTGFRFDFDWSQFCFARIGFSIASPKGHTVANHQTHTMIELLDRLVGIGHRQIGMIVTKDDDVRVENSWTAGYYIFQRREPSRHLVPPFHEPLSAPAFLKWYRRHRPEAIVTTRTEILRWLKEAGISVPEAVGVAHLDAHPRLGLAGVDQQSEEVGAAALDLVAEQLQNNEKGIPRHAKTVLIDGRWIPGPTVKDHLPKKADFAAS